MKKLKSQYYQPVNTNTHDYLSDRYPNVRSAYFKKFSNQQERSFYFMHYIEYKDYPLNLRVARGTGLPHVWDDFSADIYKVAKSWKHNSKRRHQYYKEHEIK